MENEREDFGMLVENQQFVSFELIDIQPFHSNNKFQNLICDCAIPNKFIRVQWIVESISLFFSICMIFPLLNVFHFCIAVYYRRSPPFAFVCCGALLCQIIFLVLNLFLDLFFFTFFTDGKSIPNRFTIASLEEWIANEFTMVYKKRLALIEIRCKLKQLRTEFWSRPNILYYFEHMRNAAANHTICCRMQRVRTHFACVWPLLYHTSLVLQQRNAILPRIFLLCVRVLWELEESAKAICTMASHFVRK